jgi:hypothetical protein
MKERIFKNWKTTLTGIVMLAGGLIMVGLGKASLTEYGLFAPVCFALIFVKDPSFKQTNGQA